ncbi:MAG: MAG6450 family protein [Bacillota bacterium]
MAKNKYNRAMNSHSKGVKSQGNIPGMATELKRSTEDQTPLFSFEHLCDKNFYLFHLGRLELKELHNFLKKCSRMTWKQIRMSDGMGYKTIPRSSLSCRVPDSVPDDAGIDEMRVTQEHRIFGFKVNGIFNVIWFDPTHDVCPEGKKRR